MNTTVQTISASQCWEKLDNRQNCLAIDVRTAAEVSSQRLMGASHIALQDLDTSHVLTALEQAGCDENAEVYLVCASGVRAKKAAQLLQQDIKNPLFIVEGGVAALQQAGANVSSGESRVISLERQVRIAAGGLVLGGVVLGAAVTPWFYALSAFVGAGLVFAGITDTCGMAMVLARMPWNRAAP